MRVIRKSAFTASAVSTTVTVGQFFQDKLSNGVSRAYNLPSQPMEITLMYKVGIGKDIVTKVNIDPRGYEVVEVVFSYKMTAAGFVPFLMFFQPTARIEANVNYYRKAADPYPVISSHSRSLLCRSHRLCNPGRSLSRSRSHRQDSP